MIKEILPVSFIISLRFFGLFIVLPVLSVYALSLKGANEFLVGVTIGGYALTQMLLQIPFGMLSDKIGRKVTIAIGLVIFIIGSIICANSSDIYMLMFGRFIQGAGAIGAVATAMISDMVKEEVRAKAMAVMGGSIALSFALSMMIGPFVGGHYGVDKLFYLTALFSVIAIIILFSRVKNPPKIHHDYDSNPKDIVEILKDSNLIKMNITNMLQKGMMTLAFLLIPILMLHKFGYEKSELWKVYLPAMIFGILAMAPSAIIGEKRHKAKEMLMMGIMFFAISYYLLGHSSSAVLFIVGVVLFFIGFNIHEPLMQSMASKFAKVHQKGTALGIFNSFGYMGTFIGGIFGGYFLKNYGIEVISWIVIGISLLWLLLIASMNNPKIYKNLYLNYTIINLDNAKNLHDLEGVVEWYKNESEGILVVKYNTKINSEEDILKVLS